MFSYDEKLTVDTAKIYFKPKSIDGSIENYMIFEFFPETNYLLPVETKYTSDSAYVETNELGTFTLVKIKDSSRSSTSVKTAPYNVLADEKSEISVGKNDVVYDYKLGSLEVAFFVDISGSLTDNLEETKKSIHDCSQAIFEHSNNAYVEIIGYYTAPKQSANKLIVYKNSANDKLFNSIDSVDEALETLTPFTTNTQNTLNSAIFTLNGIKGDLFSNDSSQKYAFIMSNSDYSFTNGNEYKLTIPIAVRDSFEEIYDSNIHLNFLLSKGIFANTTAVNNLKAACKPYNFGVYSNSETGYFGNTGFARIYSDAITDIFKGSICYITALTPHKVPTEVNRNAFLNSLPSSYDKSKVPAADANGNINFKDAAVKIGAADYDENGNLVFPSMLDVCSKNKLTQNGYEQYMKNRSVSERLIAGSIQITPFSDKILYEDTDGDGIPNINDPYPYEKFDSRFEIINNYNYTPSVDFVDEHYEKSQECFRRLNTNSELLSCFDVSLGPLYMSYLSSPNDFSKNDELISSLIGAMQDIDFGKHPERITNPSSLKHASYALQHYFLKTGTPISYNPIDTCELISSSVNNIDHLHRNISYLMDCAEKSVANGQSLTFAAKSNSNLKAICFDNKGADEGGARCMEELDFHISPTAHCNYVHRDWQNTVGESFGSIVASISRKGNKYTMNYRYFFIDIYEWAIHYEKEKTLISRLHTFHELGTAREFLINGSFEGTITWEAGETAYYPNIAKQIENTLMNIEGNELWDKSNEYERFYDKVKNNYTKKYILGAE